MHRIAVAALACAFVSQAGAAQEWSSYGADPGGARYSAADQINTGNVRRLRRAWTYRTGEFNPKDPATRGGSYQATPILAEGKLYVSSPFARVFAINPATGEEIWRYDSGMDATAHYAESANRGVSSWTDASAASGAACRHRIFLATLDARLIALDGETGKPCADFGAGGVIDLSKGVRLVEDDPGDYTITSPPAIVRNLVITGSAVGDNRGVELEYGIVRAFDARTGDLVWKWDPIPRDPSDPMHAHWRADQVAKTGAANAWAPLSADPARDLVFVPTGSASPDYFGGERLGDNRYANSLVALRASTGEVVWHQQLVHHDLWDYDLSAQPTLGEIRKDGAAIPAVIQGTKMGMLFAFNRETGEPIFGIEERPVPQSDIPGEQSSPTQPFPVAPPPLVRHSAVTENDAWGITPWDKGVCRKLIRQYRSKGIYTPPSIEGTIISPGYGPGAILWGGLAFDEKRQLAVVNVNEAPNVVALIPRDELRAAARSGKHPHSEFARKSGTPYGMRRETLLSPFGVPCTPPPWGSLVAVDMSRGEILWSVPFGTTEGRAPFAFKYGLPSVGGPIVTAGGVAFIGAALDGRFRAFDVETGKELWQSKLPAGGQATPMTYEIDGKQYVVIVAGGHRGGGTKPGDYVIAFALPD